MEEKKLNPKILENTRSKNGITLIALVITIIVLLILAGVALATLTGQGNIIGNAENAVGKYNNSVASEQQLLNEIEKYFQNYLEGGNEDNPPTPPTPVEPPEVNENGLATENTTIKPDPNSNIQITIPAGFAPAILTGSNSTQSLPGQDGSVANIMPADQWNSITVEDINKGIVIVDNPITYDNGQPTGTTPDFNEYVWIPIPNFEEDFQQTAWTTPYGYDANGDYVSGTGVTHPIAKNPTNDTDKQNKYWDDSTTQEYKDMLASVEHYKGFYIGRYEASQGAEDIAQSKRNISPWISLPQTEAITACVNNTTTANMHLMYGVEWDSVLNWLKENATISSSTSGVTKIMEIDDIQTNSSSWGNYSNSTGDAATDSGSQQNTGASEYWKANNIYDLAGNVWEWTQEKDSTGTRRAYRGGSYNLGGDNHPAADRSRDNESSTYYTRRVPCQLFCSTGRW